MKKTGLTLGKFAPFHRGHEFLIEKALSEVDELFVLIYDTPVTPIPLSVRAKWIKSLYPSVHVIECWDGPDGYSNERSFEILQEKYILRMLNGQKITHFYSSEFYGAHVSKCLGAMDCRVDEARINIPVCATHIRENPYLYREYISDVVYKDLITKVVFLGAMSTGKSTLAEALAQKYETTWVREYGREYWEKNQINRRVRLEEFDLICQGHLELEESEIMKANRYLFIDTNAITTYMYCMDYHGRSTDFLTQKALENSSRYDLFFLCEDDIPYDDTWDRSGPQKREIFHKKIIADLKERQIPYIPLKGTVEERVDRVGEILKSFQKYSNYFGNIRR